MLRVIAHNYLETAKDVTFALDVSGVDVISGQTQKVNIPAKGESYVDWRVKARATGNAVLTAKALTNEESDALEMTLPVLPFGVKQRAAASGVVFSGTGRTSGVTAIRRAPMPARADSPSRLRPAWRARSSTRSITSPAIRGAARSRPCPASCPT